MKKNLKSAAISTLVVAVAAVSCGALVVSAAPATPAYILKETAKKTALTHAGLTEKEVKFVTVELDSEKGQTDYEVEFYAGDKEYDYTIDAVTGKIRKLDFEFGDARQSKIGIKALPAAEKDPAYTLVISEDAAQKIALTHAGLTEKEVKLAPVKLNREHGSIDHEVKFYVGKTEYDYTIDAVTGKILEIEYDTFDDVEAVSGATPSAKPDTKSDAYIGADAAKNAALADAKLTSAGVTRLKVELDRDDGKVRYEVEFQVGNREYDYKINALTGAVISRSMDIDD